MSAPRPTDDVLRDVLTDVRGDIARERRGWRSARSWSTPAREAAVMAVVVAVTLAVLFVTPRLDLAAYPRPRLLALTAALVLCLAAALRELFRPQGLRARRAGLAIASGAALLLVPLGAALLPAPHGHVHLHPESFEGTGADFVPRAVACLVFGLVTATPALLASLALSRHASLSGARIALAAGAAGLAGTLGLLAHCPLVGVPHRVAGHGAVGIVVALLLAAGTALVRRSRKTATSP